METGATVALMKKSFKMLLMFFSRRLADLDEFKLKIDLHFVKYQYVLVNKLLI